MAHFEFSSVVPKPRLEIFDKLTKPAFIATLFPPDYKILEAPKSIPLKKGYEFPIRISRFGVSAEWRILLEDYEEGEFFRYRQTQGPFTMWVHLVKFEDHAGGTLVSDIIDFELPFGILGKLAEDLFMQRELQRIFKARSDALEKN